MKVRPLSAPSAQSKEARSARQRLWLQYVVVAFLFVAVGFTLRRGWQELNGYQWQIDHAAGGLALGLWIMTNIGAGACWIVVTRAFGVKLPVLPALRVFSTSNLGKYLPGKVLHVFARVYLVQQQGVSVAVGTTSAMLDVLLYIAAGLVFSVFALPTAMGGYQPGPMLLVGLAVLAGFALLHPRPLNAVLALGGRFVPRLRGLRIELRYSTVLGAFALYLLLWLAVTAAVYAGVESVTNVPIERAPLLGAIFAFSYVTGLFIPTPAGLGREAVMAWLFSSLMPFPAAVVATILNRLLQVAAEAICAGLLTLATRR
jgi:glycosyltransferase 2 family protein